LVLRFFLSDIYIAGEVLHYQGGSPYCLSIYFGFRSPRGVHRTLPALGITSEVIATNSRKPIFGYRAIMSILAIAFLSTIVWSPHVYLGDESILGSFTFTTLLIAIPSAVKA
jgi:cytochrome c oxidase subunit 1